MNKAITDGVVLMPTAFADGLNVYSSGDGTAGSDTYANAINAAFIPADQDFGGALERKVRSGCGTWGRRRFCGVLPARDRQSEGDQWQFAVGSDCRISGVGQWSKGAERP